MDSEHTGERKRRERGDRRVVAVDRQVQALQLRRSGCDYRTIAARCAARSAAGCAAALEGFDFLGCDTDADYVEIARRRIAHWQGPLFASAMEE